MNEQASDTGSAHNLRGKNQKENLRSCSRSKTKNKKILRNTATRPDPTVFSHPITLPPVYPTVGVDGDFMAWGAWHRMITLRDAGRCRASRLRAQGRVQPHDRLWLLNGSRGQARPLRGYVSPSHSCLGPLAPRGVRCLDVSLPAAANEHDGYSPLRHCCFSFVLVHFFSKTAL